MTRRDSWTLPQIPATIVFIAFGFRLMVDVSRSPFYVLALAS
jgi:hypothetical protein